ncbi:DUF1801 domain-containing protein [Flavobacterium sp. K77]|uniref:DUF1801 domain-containing protein n=1 Tax=Flavobacterium sp. K77 TaxID=2910676 RepID=UPI001F291C5D|nr:DUF1801 domain-containing protein [Flavobacterium sp. K77]MCF6141063.1 DUF1801 domain-containing protein [Flavobacterium sp. K77]
MAKANKTTETEVNVTDFINLYVDDDQKKIDSFQLVELMSKWSGTKPKMWGPTIIGFGNYHYKYESGHEGESMLIGFSPRKAAFSLYVTTETHDNQELLDQLGKFKMGKACIYVKKLADINIEILEQICRTTIEKIKQSH